MEKLMKAAFPKSLVTQHDKRRNNKVVHRKAESIHEFDFNIKWNSKNMK